MLESRLIYCKYDLRKISYIQNDVHSLLMNYTGLINFLPVNIIAHSYRFHDVKSNKMSLSLTIFGEGIFNIISRVMLYCFIIIICIKCICE